MTKPPLIIGVAGGTGSGKTTVAEVLLQHGGARVALLPQDAYYAARPHLPFEERERQNYDEPTAFDTALLVAHLDELLAGRPVERPTYDFARHDRAMETVRIDPRPVVLVEGILVLHEPRLRERMALKVYVDAPPDERFIRRLERDLTERGRTTESVIAQYRTTVAPMHSRFVEPSKEHADLIVPEGGRNTPAMAVLTSYLDRVLERGDAALPSPLGHVRGGGEVAHG